MHDPVVVKLFTTRLEADIAKSFLEANDIMAFVTADDRGGATPFPMQPTPTGVKLLVKYSDAEKARKLLDKKVKR
jgi:hypothetical protein